MPRASHHPPRARTRGPSGSAFDQYLLDIRKLPLITDPREERRLALKAPPEPVLGAHPEQDPVPRSG